jgi:hypothetical protein
MKKKSQYFNTVQPEFSHSNGTRERERRSWTMAFISWFQATETWVEIACTKGSWLKIS